MCMRYSGGMKRTTIILPDDLRAGVAQRASDMGVSIDEYVCRVLRAALKETATPEAAKDSLFTDAEVFEGRTPVNLAGHHDLHLHGDLQ